mgnify:CR=1 FL=1
MPHLKVVYDPVGQASVGGKLSTLNIDDLTPLFPLVDVITPNLLEAKKLAQSDSSEVSLLANAIHHLGVKSIVIKGGHSDRESSAAHCIDYCLENSDSSAQKLRNYQLRSSRIETSYSHGGGCSYATALAAFTAHGYLLRDALTLTKAFINQGLSWHKHKRAYYGAFEQLGWPTNRAYFPTVNDRTSQKNSLLLAFKNLGISSGRKLGLYPVVDSLEWLKLLLPLGLEIIQIRLKTKLTAIWTA